MRKNNLELPSANELREMIDEESPRKAARRDYLENNESIFKDFREIAKSANIDISVIDNSREMKFDETIEKLQKMVNGMEIYLSKNQENYHLYDQLNIAKKLEKSDLIFVFGAPSNLRIEKAIKIYKQGFSKKLWIAGRQPHYRENKIPEAQRMADFAVKNGIRREDIFVEDRSIETPDNVKRSVDSWEAANIDLRKIIFVTSEFHLRRAEVNLYKFPVSKIKLFGVSPEPSCELNSRNWIKSERGRRIVLNEFAKLIIEDKIDQVLAEGWG